MFRPAPSRRKPPAPKVQKTQLAAQTAAADNAKYFSYPENGFVTPIETTLIYSMINEPTVYPPEVIRQAIEAEDFREYMYIAKEQDDLCSYAQLSAILSLAMQKWPPAEQEDPSCVPQLLCKTLLRTVVQYATEHELDREHEINEFLEPAMERTRQRMDRAANMKMNLPVYAGLALSLATANPLPMYLAYTAGTMSFLNDDVVQKESANMQKVAEKSRRTANVETASLMDEVDY